METKHTPGPWIESKIGNHYEEYLIYSEETGKNVAINVDGLANARLIAAAPDMLEALKEFLADQETMNEPYRNEAICERARAAIKKATENGKFILDEDGSTATDLLIVTVGILSIGALAFTVAGLPALILLKTLAEMLR